MTGSAKTRPTAGDVQDLTVAVEQLTEETRLLRTSLDELRDDVVWAARQVLAAGDAASPGVLRRQHDPLCDASVGGPPPNAAPVAEHAMDDEEERSGIPYCCDRPKLSWNGDPESPGIACESCGYVIAEQGNVVIWREDENDDSRMPPSRGSAPEPERQNTLF